MSDQNALQKTFTAIRESATLKIIIIGLLVLILLIPSSMIISLIMERENRKSEVIQEISSKWGSRQLVAGPILTIPYKKLTEDQDKNVKEIIQYMHFLPDQLNINGEIFPEIRYRGIYEAVLYNSTLNITGTFTPPDFSHFNLSPEQVIQSGASICLSISDMKGIKEQLDIKINGRPMAVTPGMESYDVFNSGISIKVPLQNIQNNINFHITIDLNGSHGISFIPLGKITEAAIQSSWSSPSFIGAFLPYERNIGNEGFSAKWKILNLNTNYPQQWIGPKNEILNSGFGVELFIPADSYQKSVRMVKYGILFTIFTFAGIFFSELMSQTRIHPVQYLLIGLAITMFYVLLISISEHLIFGIAYLLSSSAVVLLICIYTKGIFKDRIFCSLVTGILITLYAYLYMLLQLEDYALLMGSLGLFAVLSLIMLATRKLDWYSLRVKQE